MKIEIAKKLDYLFSIDTQHKLEKIFAIIAIVLGFAHFLIIFAAKLGLIQDSYLSSQSYLSVVSTPFTVLLIFEVLLMVVSVAKSIPVSLNKQYEIVAIVLIRDVFKVLAGLRIEDSIIDQWQLVAFAIADGFFAVLVFGLIYQYVKQKNVIEAEFCKIEYEQKFMRLKQKLATFLIIIFLGFMGFYLKDIVTSSTWEMGFEYFKSINFIYELFTVMVLIDVLILFLSYIRRNSFSNVAYEAVLVVSSIIIRFAFVLTSPFNGILAVVGILLGILVTWVYAKFIVIEK